MSIIEAREVLDLARQGIPETTQKAIGMLSLVEAREVLDMVRQGANISEDRISQALVQTGDLVPHRKDKPEEEKIQPPTYTQIVDWVVMAQHTVEGTIRQHFYVVDRALEHMRGESR